MAEAYIKILGYPSSIQHVAVEGGGRPDLAARDPEGVFALIVECLVRPPNENELTNLRKKYKDRKLALAIPWGMEFDYSDSKSYFDELWVFPIIDDTEKGKSTLIVPVDSIRITEQFARIAFPDIMKKADSNYPVEYEYHFVDSLFTVKGWQSIASKLNEAGRPG